MTGENVSLALILAIVLVAGGIVYIVIEGPARGLNDITIGAVIVAMGSIVSVLGGTLSQVIGLNKSKKKKDTEE